MKEAVRVGRGLWRVGFMLCLSGSQGPLLSAGWFVLEGDIVVALLGAVVWCEGLSVGGVCWLEDCRWAGSELADDQLVLNNDQCARAWAGSGAMYLTGRSDGPPRLEPAGIVRPLTALAEVLAATTRQIGREVVVDPLGLLAERAAFTGFGRNGDQTVGGDGIMLRAADGWIALNLPRPRDLASLPALTVGAVTASDDWAAIKRSLSRTPSRQIVETASLLGLAVASVAEVSATDGLPGGINSVAGLTGVINGSAGLTGKPAAPSVDGLTGLGAKPVVSKFALSKPAVSNSATARPAPMKSVLTKPAAARPAAGNPVLASRAPVVIDLTSLWAGPLAGRLLAAAGAQVVKVESASRPDGARLGPAGFFARLNNQKAQIQLDLPEPAAIRQLRNLIRDADLVLESSRPRVMQQWGINIQEVVEAGTSWVSITGYGRSGPSQNRVAFGDDAAVAGGLVLWDAPPAFSGDRHEVVASDGLVTSEELAVADGLVAADGLAAADSKPMFVADAIADPISGLVAAVAAARLLDHGTAALVDITLSEVSAWVAAQAGPPILRPVIQTGGGWIVDLSDGPVGIRTPSIKSPIQLP